ncbi:nucleoside-diphosphate sugar epimerase/dehydratase [Flavobacterium sp. SUN046]|uniref:polysaccharide biosynthesis protein n=1 Tax=Flavobacterium sp. SUN046 TaxID=3002440 RepID=UPI002DB757F1|nr:nucleoside-diphosphate sugar epimerase/dehydratase [Flavobacterium sp. SUN046]MEC4050894.1 nucleoside-diphosphate sugar epimerase/dehydratase [Flavobacterium sp. SUN046]
MKNNTNKNFLTPFFKVFSEINFEFSFRNLGYLPRWLILLLDLCIVVFSCVVTYFLLLGLRLNYIPNQDHIVYAGAFYLLLNAFFFWLYRTYSGIIRHSSHIDALKLFFSQFSTFVVIILLNTILLVFDESKLFLTTGVFINAVLTFCLLFFYRIIVKQIFDKFFLNTNSNKRINAIIYGSDANAIAVANALTSERPARFKLLGFIDKNNENYTKRILDLPIIPIKRTLPVLMRLMKVEALILADNSLSKDEKFAIVEECIEYNFKVYTIPVVSDWEDQKEISKKIKNFEIHDLLERKPIVLDTRSISLRINRKTVLVSGAAGSIGSEIVRQILNFNPTRIVILDQAETPLHSLSLELEGLGKTIDVHNVIADIRNYDSLNKIFEQYKPDLVYHAAAYKHVPMMEENPSQAIFTNVLGTKNLADLSQKYHVERFVMISTDKAVNPSSVMGASKRIAEMYVQSKHFKHKRLGTDQYTKFITTRFGNVLGSNGSVVPLFTKQIQEGGPITITHPDIIRYFMTIPEACQLVLEACSMGSGGEIYIFDMGKPVKIIDLAKKMIRLAGFKPDLDIKIKIVGLRPGEKLYEELLNDSAKNLATHHEKIMIAEEICDDYEIVSQQIENLIELAKYSEGNQIVSKMKKIVPEFKSLNSVYEVLNHKS